MSCCTQSGKQQPPSLCSLVVPLRHTHVTLCTMWTFISLKTVSGSMRLSATGHWFCLLVQRGSCDCWCLVLVVQFSIARLPSYTLGSQVLGTLTLKACEWLAPSDSKVIATVLLVLAVSCACDLPCHRSQITIFPSLSVPFSEPPQLLSFLPPPSQ